MYVANGKSKKDLSRIATNLSKYPQVNYKIINSKEIAQNFPQMKYGKEYDACWEKNAGVLFAEKCLSTVQKRFKELGGTLIDGFEVMHIHAGPPAVVQGAKMRNWVKNKPERKDESYSAKAVIICAGPWTGPLAKNIFGLSLPLSPKRIEVMYWQVKDKQMGGPPIVFIDLMNDGEYYGLPSLEYPGMVKLCCNNQHSADPNTRDTLQQKPSHKGIIDYVKKHFPSLEPRPAIIETCMYTAILDTFKEYNFEEYTSNLSTKILFRGLNDGTGFKISPVVAHILGNMAEGKPTVHNIQPFALSRFQSRSKL
ncbi:hypothetical protein J437_LFUL016823 [Ladona fulva]|uniref:FAD dependent oxidoreductase domain-containing protein n=1 Tax=Ladona fulva TaxID=123851 RepID=A0A8K0PAB3_LADFU|nr:hypothetical protein J437_LFUL016823 [Ladona fulva]